MSKKFYAQTDALGFPIPGTMMSAETVPAVDNILEITKEMTLPVHPTGLQYYIRLDEKGNILPNSVFVHYDTLDEEGVVTLQGSAAPTGGLAVKVSYNGMMVTPVCELTATNLTITIPDGYTIANAPTISGDFASLGAYYTPAVPGNMMQQPPQFQVAWFDTAAQAWKNRQFTLTGVGAASGADPMFGQSPARFCSTYYVADQYINSCDSVTGTDVGVMSTAAPLVVGKYYRNAQGTPLTTFRIKSVASTPNYMSTTMDDSDAYDTCVAGLGEAPPPPPIQDPVLSINTVTPGVAQVSYQAQFVNPDSVTILEAGIVIGAASTVTIADAISSAEITDFSSGFRFGTIPGLTSSTLYHIRTYVVTAAGTTYSSVGTVTTLAPFYTFYTVNKYNTEASCTAGPDETFINVRSLIVGAPPQPNKFFRGAGDDTAVYKVVGSGNSGAAYVAEFDSSTSYNVCSDAFLTTPS